MICSINNRKIFAAAAIAVIMCALMSSRAEAKTQKPAMPPYRPSGIIPGTDLKYERLVISDAGVVSIYIVNERSAGVSFSSNFSFFNNKGVYLTGFNIKDFAPPNGKIRFVLDLDEYKKLKKASSMKVLGRAGRMGKAPEYGEGES
ncbi:MAG: hypothetical protein LBT23_06960 [Synergistaceae bacterium]|jgi:hypothetical protein|nr:hypothetical protein [Synergistaceae bacterium]